MNWHKSFVVCVIVNLVWILPYAFGEIKSNLNVEEGAQTQPGSTKVGEKRICHYLKKIITLDELTSLAKDYEQYQKSQQEAAKSAICTIDDEPKLKDRRRYFKDDNMAEFRFGAYKHGREETATKEGKDHKVLYSVPMNSGKKDYGRVTTPTPDMSATVAFPKSGELSGYRYRPIPPPFLPRPGEMINEQPQTTMSPIMMIFHIIVNNNHTMSINCPEEEEDLRTQLGDAPEGAWKGINIEAVKNLFKMDKEIQMNKEKAGMNGKGKAGTADSTASVVSCTTECTTKDPCGSTTTKSLCTTACTTTPACTTACTTTPACTTACTTTQACTTACTTTPACTTACTTACKAEKTITATPTIGTVASPTVDTVPSPADDVLTTAGNVLTTANNVLTTAGNVLTSAGNVLTTADNVIPTADTANPTTIETVIPTTLDPEEPTEDFDDDDLDIVSAARKKTSAPHYSAPHEAEIKNFTSSELDDVFNATQVSSSPSSLAPDSHLDRAEVSTLSSRRNFSTLDGYLSFLKNKEEPKVVSACEAKKPAIFSPFMFGRKEEFDPFTAIHDLFHNPIFGKPPLNATEKESTPKTTELFPSMLFRKRRNMSSTAKPVNV